MEQRFLDWYRRLWGTTPGDDEAELASVERRLDVQLPGLLRAVYLHTAMRDSSMLHLSELEALRLEDDVLVFATEQQANFSWGIRLGDLADENPPLVSGTARSWVDDQSTLEDLLKFFALVNRSSEPPFIDQSSYDPNRLNGEWKEHRVAWTSLQHSMWTNGEAVLEPNVGALGARDLDALRRAARSLDIDDDEIADAVSEEDDGESDSDEA
jgi:hypothetical protein